MNHMHRICTLLTSLLAFTGLVQAAGEKNVVPSILRSATIYRTGAELTHTASYRIGQGSSELVIGDLSSTIDLASLRVTCAGTVTVMSVTFSTEYLKPESMSPSVRRLRDSLDQIKKEMAKLEVLIRSDSTLLEVLSANKSIRGANGLSVAELTKLMDYYKQKTIELDTDISNHWEKNEKWQMIKDKLEKQIEEEEKKNSRTGGQITLQLQSAASGNIDFTISYVTMLAGWTPFYDLKVNNVNDPLHIFYKARLSQTTGLDWKKVKLTLSTSQPERGGNAPVMKTWFLQFVSYPSIQIRGISSLSNNSNLYSNYLSGRVAGVQTQSAPSQDIAVSGYGAADKYKARIAGQDTVDYISVNDNQMDVTFDIDLPYDVPANGKEQGIVLKEYMVPCIYQYYAAPRLDREAYLLGGLVDWEKLNLLPGEANIIVDGANIGKSVIDPASTADTLKLTLGRDKRIVVKKEKLNDFSSVRFLGGNKKQVFTYELTVRNNKNEKVQMLLKDQYPISTSKDIEEELLESSGAAVNSETGFLTWQTELAPGETKKYRVSYSLKYPKDKIVNIN